jgi:hypothetical protein
MNEAEIEEQMPQLRCKSHFSAEITDVLFSDSSPYVTCIFFFEYFMHSHPGTYLGISSLQSTHALLTSLFVFLVFGGILQFIFLFLHIFKNFLLRKHRSICIQSWDTFIFSTISLGLHFLFNAVSAFYIGITTLGLL